MINCPDCSMALDPNDFTICAMRVYTCPCGHEMEYNVREAAEMLAQLQAENDALRAELRRHNPFAGIDL